jgi:hypothetical protein
MAKYNTQADAMRDYHFSKIPAAQPERSAEEVLEESIRDAIAECDLILTGARTASDERHIAIYQGHRDRLVNELKRHGFYKEGDENPK